VSSPRHRSSHPPSPKRRLWSTDFDNPQLYCFSGGKICRSIGAGSWPRTYSELMPSFGPGSIN
jgi:hypothetical protein